MLRGVWLAALLAIAGCKVVNSTAFDDAGIDSNFGVVVGFSSSETRVGENTVAQIPVLVGGTITQDVTLSYRTIEGTAVAGSDYTGTTGTLRFSFGETMKFIQVTIINDGFDEGLESFAIELYDVSGAQLVLDTHTVTIGSNITPSASFVMASSAASESVVSYVELALSEPSDLPVTVAFAIGGTASSFLDYSISTTMITFPPGSVREFIAISKIEDQADELDESVSLNIEFVVNGLVGFNSSHVHTIVDNDPQPTIQFSTFEQSVAEGNDSTRVFTISLVLSAASGMDITLPFTAHSSSTADAADYTIVTPSPLIVQAGTTFTTLTVTVTGDTTLEGTESIVLQLLTPTNASLGAIQQHTMRITNDECLGSGSFAVCPDVPLTADVTLPADITTDMTPLCGSTPQNWTGTVACFVYGRTITVSSTRVTGQFPIVLVAAESITIASSLDVSGGSGMRGPGGRTGTCTQPTPPAPRAGGAGGSFMTVGGNGGGHTNGAGGIAAPPESAPVYLYGGCAGQTGGENFIVSYGQPGGAVYLVAGQSITLSPGATINASGGGAGPGDVASNGGSGGGAGGMIVLEAPSIQAASAFLVANGGGGAQGGALNRNGNPGDDPDPLQPFAPAAGGSGNGGGNGGAGFAQGFPAANGVSATNNNGAGGGGGGAGYIRSNQPLLGASVSPTPAIIPTP